MFGLNPSQLLRNQRFPASYHHAVETVVNMLMPHITQKFRDNPEASKNANHSLAVFIKVGTPGGTGLCCGNTVISKTLPSTVRPSVLSTLTIAGMCLHQRVT